MGTSQDFDRRDKFLTIFVENYEKQRRARLGRLKMRAAAAAASSGGSLAATQDNSHSIISQNEHHSIFSK